MLLKDASDAPPAFTARRALDLPFEAATRRLRTRSSGRRGLLDKGTRGEPLGKTLRDNTTLISSKASRPLMAAA